MGTIWLKVLVVVAGCSQTVPPTPARPPKGAQTSFTHEAPFERVWSAAIDTIRERKMAVAHLDKESGLVTSEWRNLPDDWDVENTYAECDSRHGTTHGVRARLDLRVKPGTPTTLSIIASFSELRSDGRIDRPFPCESRGLLEREVNEAIARRAAREPAAPAPAQPMQVM